MGNRVAITGSHGFVGGAVVAALREAGHVAVELPRITSIVQDDYGLKASERLVKLLDRSGADSLLHLAWKGLPDYSSEATGRNARLSLFMHEAWAKSSMATMLGIGSFFEYGEALGPIDETTTPVNQSFFGQTKFWLGEHLRTIAAEHQKSYLWLRPFWLYGPGQRESSLIPSALRLARQGDRLELKTPEHYVDFLHVRDFASSVISLLEVEKASGVFNVGHSRPIMVGEVADTIFSLQNNLEPNPFSGPGPDSIASWSTNRRLAEFCSWSPSIELEEILTTWSRVEAQTK